MFLTDDCIGDVSSELCLNTSYISIASLIYYRLLTRSSVGSGSWTIDFHSLLKVTSSQSSNCARHWQALATKLKDCGLVYGMELITKQEKEVNQLQVYYPLFCRCDSGVLMQVLCQHLGLLTYLQKGKWVYSGSFSKVRLGKRTGSSGLMLRESSTVHHHRNRPSMFDYGQGRCILVVHTLFTQTAGY